MKKYNIAIVGATGLVGRTFIKLIEEFNIPINNLFLYASKRSKGKIIKCNNIEYIVNELNVNDFNNIDFVLMSAGSEVSKKYAPIFEKKGCIVIDNSSYFRMNEDIPLIVPEVNYSSIYNRKRNIISNPNCSTIQSVVCLYQISKTYKLKKIVYNTYQSVSGSGMKGIDEYNSSFEGEEHKIYKLNISKTCIPYIGDIQNNFFTDEENKMINETKKILSIPNLEVIATCVRVPIKYCHGVSVYVETFDDIDLGIIKKNFTNERSIIYLENDIPDGELVHNQDLIYVGRLRQCSSNSVIFYCVGDNIRKGAASNALQILSKMIYELNKI